MIIWRTIWIFFILRVRNECDTWMSSFSIDINLSHFNILWTIWLCNFFFWEFLDDCQCGFVIIFIFWHINIFTLVFFCWNLQTYFSIHSIYLINIWCIFIFSRSVLFNITLFMYSVDHHWGFREMIILLVLWKILILWGGNNNLRIIISQRTMRILYWVNTISKEISFHFFFHQYFCSHCRKPNYR